MHQNYRTPIPCPTLKPSLSAKTIFATLRCLAASAFATSALGVTIVETDFTDRTISGDTASNISYTTNGVSDPGDLTVTSASPSLNGLFDTATAQGFFAPDLNTSAEGQWSVSVPLSLTATSITIDAVVLDGAMFNNAGDSQGENPRRTNIEVSFVGSTSGLIGSQTLKASNSSGDKFNWSAPLSYDFSSSSIVLSNTETWNMVIATLSGEGGGNNTGLGSFSVTGTAIPEPTTTAALCGLAALGVCLLYRRRSSQRP